jgi:hypothetical protein
VVILSKYLFSARMRGLRVTWSLRAVKTRAERGNPEARSIRNYSQLTTGDSLGEALHADSHFKAFESALV